MIRKIGNSIIALLVLASSTFFVAPMAFCQMVAETEAPVSCCEQPAEETQHCDDSHAECPICSYDLCDADPTPAKTEVPTSIDAHLEFVTIPFVTITHNYADVLPAPAPTIIDSGPPIYLLDSVFRI